MVSKARLDFPDPDKPVKTMRASRGSSREMLRKIVLSGTTNDETVSHVGHAMSGD